MAASSRTPAEDVSFFLLQSNVTEQKTLLNLQHYFNLLHHLINHCPRMMLFIYLSKIVHAVILAGIPAILTHLPYLPHLILLAVVPLVPIPPGITLDVPVQIV